MSRLGLMSVFFFLVLNLSFGISSFKVDFIKVKAESDNPLDKMDSLLFIERLYQEGDMNEDAQPIFDVLKTIATEAYFEPAGVGTKTVLNDHPLVRKQAAQLMGLIKGDGSARILVEMATHEEDFFVLKDVLYSLAKIGHNEKYNISRAIYTIILRMNLTHSIDNETAFAAVSAVEEMVQNNKEHIDDNIYQVVILVQNGGYNRMVRQKIDDVVEMIWDLM